MDLERAYLYLEHMSVMLDHGNVAALRLDEEAERRCYVDAIGVVLPVMEQCGVTVDKGVHLE